MNRAPGHIEDLEPLQLAIGYTFRRVEFLVRALTHRSYANEFSDPIADNQRLEFLGDSVLGLVTAETLFRRFPTADEGFLSSVQAALVRESALATIAHKIQLGDYLRLGKGEDMSGGRNKASLLADAYEALLAAIYFDGGLEAVRTVMSTLHSDAMAELNTSTSPEDNKSRLQRVIQSGSTTRPVYTIVEEHGPAHERVFVAEVSVGGKSMGRGEGRTKKEAQQRAARAALHNMK